MKRYTVYIQKGGYRGKPVTLLTPIRQSWEKSKNRELSLRHFFKKSKNRILGTSGSVIFGKKSILFS